MPEAFDAALAATFDPELDRVARIFRDHGGTDFGYLAWHFRRFRETKQLFEQTSERRGLRVLDVGAHWLRKTPVLRRNLHVEVELPRKERGITISPTF